MAESPHLPHTTGFILDPTARLASALGNRLQRDPGAMGTYKRAASPACVAADRLLITGSQGTRELPSGGHGPVCLSVTPAVAWS